MKKILSSYLIPLLVTSCVILPVSAEECLDWDIDDYVLAFKEKTGWKGKKGNETFTYVYKMPDETAENWTEKLEVTNLPIAITFGNKTHWNAESILNTSKKNNCSDWIVINKSENSILYERHNINCQGTLHTQEVGRILMGKWYLWWISHGIRNKNLSADKRKIIINNLKRAKIVIKAQ